MHHSPYSSPSGLSDRTTAYQLRRQKNQRMALILASIAATFFVGFIAKMTLL